MPRKLTLSGRKERERQRMDQRQRRERIRRLRDSYNILEHGVNAQKNMHIHFCKLCLRDGFAAHIEDSLCTRCYKHQKKIEPRKKCSVPKDDVEVMAYEGTSIENIIKLEEVDIKPDILFCETLGCTDTEAIDGQRVDDEPEICTDEEIKEFNEKDIDVKSEIATDDPLREEGRDTMSNNCEQGVPKERVEESQVEIYVDGVFYGDLKL